MDRIALGAGWNRLKQGTLWRKYAQADPNEATRLDAYVNAVAAGRSVAPPTLSTATGNGLLLLVEAGLAPDPSPTPVPTPTPTPTPSTGLDSSGRFFTDSRSRNPAWWQTVGSPAVSPNSARLVANWKALGTPLAAIRSYTVPVFKASASDPKHDVRITMYPPSLGNVILGVPIPANATPSPGTDAHMVIDADTYAIDFWKMTKDSSGNWSAGAAIAYAKPSVGLLPNPGCRASGIPLPLGMIRPEEIVAGHMDHALGFAVAPQGGKVLRPPRGGAAFTGGSDESLDAVHCGTLIFLDASYDPSTAPAGFERTVYATLKERGAYMIDGGGGSLGFGALGPAGWDQVAGIEPLSEEWIAAFDDARLGLRLDYDEARDHADRAMATATDERRAVSGSYFYFPSFPWDHLRVADYSLAVSNPPFADEQVPGVTWGLV